MQSCYLTLENASSRNEIIGSALAGWNGNDQSGTWKVFDSQIGREASSQYNVVIEDTRYCDIAPGVWKTITIKMGSRTTMAAQRHGNRIDFQLTSKRYKPTVGGWTGWRERVEIQRWTGSRWASVGTLKPNARGVATGYIINRKARAYRAISPGTTRIWGSESRTLRR